MPADNNASKSGLFSPTPPMPSGTPPTQQVSPMQQSATTSAQPTAKPNGLFGATPALGVNANASQTQQSPIPPVVSPSPATANKPSAASKPFQAPSAYKARNPWWATRQGRTGIGICASLAIIVPICFALSRQPKYEPTPPVTGQTVNGVVRQDHRSQTEPTTPASSVAVPPPVVISVPPQPPSLSDLAKQQMQAILEIVGYDYRILQTRYKAAGGVTEVNPADIDSDIDEFNSLSVTECPNEFQMACNDYVQSWEDLKRSEMRVIDFSQNAGSSSAKIWATIQMVVDFKTKTNGSDSTLSETDKTEMRIAEAHAEKYENVCKAKQNLEDVAAQHGVYFRGVNQ